MTARGEVALAYHRATEHNAERLRRHRSTLDRENRPHPFKRYAGLDVIPLPTSLGADDWLVRTLYFAAGCIRTVGGTPFFRAAPSAGALYPIEVYVVCGELSGLPAGVYHFAPGAYGLHPLRDGDHRGALAAAAADSDIASSPASLVLCGIPWRTTWKYGARGYRHLFWDAGTILANVLALEPAARLLMGFVDDEVAALVDVRAPHEFPLAVVPLRPGDGTGSPAVAEGSVPLLNLEVVPISKSPIELPEITRVHAAGDLAHADEVQTWRRSAASAGVGRASVPADAVALGDVEDLILRKGSTRRFRRERVGLDVFGRVLPWAASAVPMDAVVAGDTLLHELVAVHDVDRLEPGIGVLRDAHLDVVRHGDVRDEVRHLCLDQPLGGDGAYTVFPAAPLDRVLGALGDRGYRAAQLEAGIVAGRLHLGAFALGVGASGLTFFDDEVRTFFDTDSSPMIATAVGVPDYGSRPGRRSADMPWPR